MLHTNLVLAQKKLITNAKHTGFVALSLTFGVFSCVLRDALKANRKLINEQQRLLMSITTFEKFFSMVSIECGESLQRKLGGVGGEGRAQRLPPGCIRTTCYVICLRFIEFGGP